MVRATRAILVECEPPIKQIIMDLDEKKKKNGEPSFIIEDFGEGRIAIAPESLEEIQARLDEILEENSYKMADI
jgi:hypothetical protein